MSGMYPATNGKPVFHEFITPIGLFCHLYHDKPSAKTDRMGQPELDKDTGLPLAEFKATLAWDKTRIAELEQIIALANQAKAEAWPQSVGPNAFFALEPFFRDGDNPAHNTKGKEYLFGKYYLNFKQKAIASRDPQTGQITYTGAPGLLGPYGPEDKIMPIDVYAGCTGRVSGVIFATTYMGKNFITTRLNNIQKYEDGERIGGGTRPSAGEQFGALKTGGAQSGLGGLGSITGNKMI
jgi:hypothetical protein